MAASLTDDFTKALQEREASEAKPVAMAARTGTASSYLSRIESGLTKLPRRVLLYGTEGIGKSTWAASAPKCIFVPTEDGLGDIDCQRFPLCSTFQEVIGCLSELYSGKHPYRSVAIDSLDWLEKIIWAKVADEAGKSNIEEIGYARGYKLALTQWREVLEGLNALRSDRNMTVILIAHAVIERFSNPEGEDFDRFQPNLNKHARGIIQEWSDEILFASYKILVKKEDKGFNVKRGKAIGAGSRVIRTTESPAFVAKNRIGLPEELPLEWKEFAKHLRTTPTPNGKTEKKGA